MLVMAGAIWLSGCSAVAQRDSLKIDKALIGHWVNSNGSSDYYFSDTGFTKVEKDGSTTNMTYIVVKSNDNENTITIRVSKPAGILQDEDTRDIKFSADKKTMTETVNILGIKISENSYSYADSKTTP
jgi:hypothetical protein